MSEQDTNDEKNEEPTEKRLQDARNRGEVPKSTDLTYATALLGLIIAFVFLAESELSKSLNALAFLISDTELLKTGRDGPLALKNSILNVILPAFVLLLIPAVFSLTSLLAQRGVAFSTEKLTPKMNKISPLASIKNKFGRAGLFEFLKSSTKLTLVSSLIAIFLHSQSATVIASSQLSPVSVIGSITYSALFFLLMILVFMTVIGAIDLLWQHRNHRRKNMMSRKEILDEHKESEGDPQTKAQRRQRAQDIAMNQMLLEVPNASVVIVNPTHYAVALQWSLTSKSPPTCVAKGVDEIAARIRIIAKENNVPIYSDPPTARSLFASVGLGEFIGSGHFRAVAVAIRFAQKMRSK